MIAANLEQLRGPTEFPHLVVPNTGDRKLGPGWSGTYRPVGHTCPTTCALLHLGKCYALRGHVAHWAQESAKRRDSLLKCLGTPRIRHLISGDGFRTRQRARVDLPYWEHVSAFHAIDREAIGLIYSHGYRQLAKAGIHPQTMPGRLTLLASVDTHKDAIEAQAGGWRTARTTDDLGDRRPDEKICPYDGAKCNGAKPKVTCATCQLCWSGANIVFWRF
jgi:hypothetical protein